MEKFDQGNDTYNLSQPCEAAIKKVNATIIMHQARYFSQKWDKVEILQ